MRIVLFCRVRVLRLLQILVHSSSMEMPTPMQAAASSGFSFLVRTRIRCPRDASGDLAPNGPVGKCQEVDSGGATSITSCTACSRRGRVISASRMPDTSGNVSFHRRNACVVILPAHDRRIFLCKIFGRGALEMGSLNMITAHNDAVTVTAHEISMSESRARRALNTNPPSSSWRPSENTTFGVNSAASV